MTLSNHIAIGLMLEVKLGKMLQTEKNAQNDLLRPYLRAAHIQPGGQLDLNVDMKEMWFSDREVRELDLRPGDGVIVEGGAGFGRAAYLENGLDGWGFQNSIIRLRGLPANVRYAVYALGAALEAGEIALACNAATFAHFTAEKVQRFRIPFHGAEEHARIVDYLDRETGEIDAMLAKLASLSESVSERRREIVRSILKSVGQTVRLGLVVDVVSGSGFPDRYQGISDEELPFYKVSSLSNADRQVLTDSDNTVSREIADQLGARVIPSQSVVMAKIGAALLLARYALTARPSCIDNNMQALVPHQGVIISRFLAYAMEGVSIPSLVKPGPVPSLDVMGMKMSRIAYNPSLKEQCRIADHLDEVTGRIDAMLAKIDELRALLVERRAALITDVVTGRKKIPA